MIYKNNIIDSLFKSFDKVRYAAIYKENDLLFKQRRGLDNDSAAETDKFEELLVNPALLTIAKQRGDIDCGGLNFIIIGYGNFYQLIKNVKGGHISICLAQDSDLTILPNQIFDYLNNEFPELDR